MDEFRWVQSIGRERKMYLKIERGKSISLTEQENIKENSFDGK